MRSVYLAIAFSAAILVWFTSDAINTFLGKSSMTGAIVLFAILPLAAILTRPVVVSAQRGRTQRALGLIYAIRSGGVAFFVKSLALWVVLTTAVVTLIGFLYHEAEMQGAAGVANWWYVTNAFVLFMHLIPGRFRLPAARPVTFVVAGPKQSGKSSFIGLLPLEDLPHDWSVMPSENARRLLLSLHGRARGETEPDLAPGRARLTFTRPRPWSPYIGTRPVPVDFIELADLADLPSSTGIVLTIPATGDITGEIARQLQAIRATKQLTAPDGRIVPPVAVVLTKVDLAPNTKVPEEAIELLRGSCRTWKGFAASDRGGGESDVEGFSPKGYMAAALWLLDNT